MPPAYALHFTVHEYWHESPAIEVRFDVAGDSIRARIPAREQLPECSLFIHQAECSGKGLPVRVG